MNSETRQAYVDDTDVVDMLKSCGYCNTAPASYLRVTPGFFIAQLTPAARNPNIRPLTSLTSYSASVSLCRHCSAC